MVTSKFRRAYTCLALVLIILLSQCHGSEVSNCIEYYNKYWKLVDYSGIVSEKGRYTLNKVPYFKISSDHSYGPSGLAVYQYDTTRFYSKISVGDSILKLSGSLVFKVFKLNGDIFTYDMRDECCAKDRSGCK